MDLHPLCKILPEMPTADYQRLVEDIRVKGLMHAITTFDGKILDGRHRFTACKDAGVIPRYEPYTGTDPAGYVASSCVHRSLTPSQRAFIAAGFLEYEKAQAKSRQGSRKDIVETFPLSDEGKSRDKAGERMHVSGRSVDDAAKIIASAVPELVEKVRNGAITLSEAKKIALEISTQEGRKIMALYNSKREETFYL